MLKKIRVLPPLPGSTQCRLNRERLAVHGGEDQIVWYCEDKQAQVFFTDSSPFSPGDSIQIGRPIRVPPKEQSRAYAYYVQCTPGSRVSGTIFVAASVSQQPMRVKPETVTITIGRTVFPFTCHVRQLVDEVVWVSPEDSTARIEFKNSPFHKNEFDAYELTGQSNGNVGSYKYTVYVDDQVIDPVIVIEPPPP